MTTKLEELTETRAALRGRMQHFNNEAKTMLGRVEKAGSRDFTPDEQQHIDSIYAKFNAAEQELNAIEREIADETAFAQRQAELDPANSRRVVPPQNVAARAATIITSRKSARFQDLFPRAESDPYRGQFRSLGELCLAVAASAHKLDPRLISNSSMTEGTGATAGFLVPDQFIQGILDAALAVEAIRPNALVLPMTGKTLETAGWNYEDGASAKRAGLSLTWGAEGGTLSEQQAIARKISFTAKKASILCRVSSELAEDAGAFDTQLSNAMTAAVASGLDLAFTSGTGAGDPLGILNSPALITVAKESSPAQAANTILLPNLAKMLARLTPASYSRSTWLVHPTCLPELLQLQAKVLNQAASDYVGGSQANAVTQGADGQLRIYGRPVIVTDACSALSSAGDVVLADLTQYAIAIRRDARIEVSRDAYFTTDDFGFKLTLRCDGQGLPSTATKLRDGTNTVSPFVALGAR